jgi:hypothetical protein
MSVRSNFILGTLIAKVAAVDSNKSFSCSQDSYQEDVDAAAAAEQLRHLSLSCNR